jgi:hypothetical protein
MAEKVLFEYRVERDESGYHYNFRRGDQSVEIKSSIPFNGSACRRGGRMWSKPAFRAGYHDISRRRAAQKALEALEKLYQDIYSRETESPEPKP